MIGQRPKLLYYPRVVTKQKVYIVEMPHNMMANETSIGTAYAFFHYGGKTEDLLKELPYVREDTETPSELTLDLVEGVKNLDTKNDSALVDIVKQAGNMSHVLKATLPGVDNRKAANYLGNIVNGIYNTPLYQPSEPFYPEIAYKIDGQYVLRED